MWICPNCQHEEEVPTRCSRCHFDGSADALRYPTLIPKSGKAFRSPKPKPQKARKDVNPDAAKREPVQNSSSQSKASTPKNLSVSDIDFNITLDTPSSSKTPEPAAKAVQSTTQEVPPKGGFAKRLIVVLIGAALCIGGVVLVLHSHKAALPAASSAVSSAAVSIESDDPEPTVSSGSDENGSSVVGTSAVVQAYKNSKLYAQSQSFQGTSYAEYQITYENPSESALFSYTQTVASYQGMSYVKAVLEGQTQTYITRDGFSYELFPSKKIMLKTAVSTQNSAIDFTDEESIEQMLNDGTLVLTTSTETIDGTDYHAETLSGKFAERTLDDGTSYSYTTTYCFEGDTLRYILVTDEQDGKSASTQMKVLRQSHDVDTSLFELPDYKVYTNASGKYYDANGNELDYTDLYS